MTPKLTHFEEYIRLVLLSDAYADQIHEATQKLVETQRAAGMASMNLSGNELHEANVIISQKREERTPDLCSVSEDGAHYYLTYEFCLNCGRKHL